MVLGYLKTDGNDLGTSKKMIINKRDGTLRFSQVNKIILGLQLDSRQFMSLIRKYRSPTHKSLARLIYRIPLST